MSCPKLLTPGRIAEVLGAPLGRVTYVLATRRHILPAARAGNFRLYNREGLMQIQHELHTIDARRGGKAGDGE